MTQCYSKCLQKTHAYMSVKKLIIMTKKGIRLPYGKQTQAKFR